MFDQEKNGWFTWSGEVWLLRAANDGPIISHPHFTGTGTRNLRPNGARDRRAVHPFSRRFFLMSSQPSSRRLISFSKPRWVGL